MSSRASSGCLVAIVVVALVIGALTLLLGNSRSTRLALGARPYVSVGFSMRDAEGREEALESALRRLPGRDATRSIAWNRVGDTLVLTVQRQGGPEQQDALRAEVEAVLPAEFEAGFVEQQSFERAPRWVGRIHHRVHRIGQRLRGLLEDD